MWTVDGNRDQPAGDGVVDGEGIAIRFAGSAQEEVAVAAVPDAPAGILLKLDEKEIGPAFDGLEVGVGAYRVHEAEAWKAERALGGEDPKQGRRRVELAVPVEEVGVGDDAAPLLGDERGAHEGNR